MAEGTEDWQSGSLCTSVARLHVVAVAPVDAVNAQLAEVTVGPPLWSTVPVSLLCLPLENTQRVRTHEKTHTENIGKETTKRIIPLKMKQDVVVGYTLGV